MKLPDPQEIATKYCMWLNEVGRSNNEDPMNFEPTDFLIWNPRESKFGQCFCQLAATEDPWVMSRWYLDDGDEGGGTQLYIWSHQETGAIQHMVQSFDTMVGHIMFEGELINTKGFDYRSGGDSK